MLLPLFQFTASPAPTAMQTDSDTLLLGALVLVGVLAITMTILFIVRAVLRSQTRAQKAFNRVVLQILVPKERKSEGQGGQVGQDDRIDQIREEIAITETFFSALSGLRAQRGIHKWLTGRSDHISCEIVAHNNLTYFYIDVPKRQKQLIEQQIHAQFPYAEIEEMTDYNIFGEHSHIIGGYVTAQRESMFPLKTYKTMDSDPLSPILNALAKAHTNNSALAVQFIFRSAHKRWRRKATSAVRDVKKGGKVDDVFASGTSKALKASGKALGELFKSKDQQQPEEQYRPSQMEEEMLKGIEEKISKGGSDVTIRLLSVSDNQETAQLNLDNLMNAFSQYNLYRYGNDLQAALPRTQSRVIRDFIYRAFNERFAFTINTEEMASLWHPPIHATEAPNIRWLTGRKAPPPPNLPDDGLLLGFINYRGIKKDVYLQTPDRRRHLYIIGKSGSGKSVTIANLAKQDITEGHGVCVVDPHGDLIEDLLEHVPKERADDVVIFDPSDMDRPMGLNMLEAKDEDQRDFAVQEMIGIFHKLFPPEMIGPMFEHNMRNVMLTLMADTENPGTVIDIPRMFTDDDFAMKYRKKLNDPVVRAYWEKEMDKTSDFHKSEMLGYLVSKLGRFAENTMMRNIMGQQHSGFDFRKVMDERKILFVNLAKGKTGEVNAKLLGLIVVAKIQMAAMGRADMPEDERHDFFLYIDEFQNFITDSISTILSEARKYRLDMILAHQYMGQLTDDKGSADVRDAVLGNVGTMMVGRIGPDDAELLAKEFSPNFGSYDLLNPPRYSFYTKVLIDGNTSKPFNMQAYPPEDGNRELAGAVKQLARLKYARDRKIVEAEIHERTQLEEPAKASKTDMIEPTL